MKTQELINLTSIRALYQEHLKELKKTWDSEHSISGVYNLKKAIRQRHEECQAIGYNIELLEMSEDDFNNWLKSQLGKGVTP